jgi:N-acetyl-beta-hexosaminidase
MNKTRCLLICIFLGVLSSGFAQAVNIVYDKASPEANYAANILEKAILSKGYKLNNTKADLVITLSINAKQFDEEAYAILAEKRSLTVTGGDQRGMIYGSLWLAEELRNGSRLENIKSRSEKPNYKI